MKSELVNRIKEFRIYHKLSESELAEKLDVDVSVIFNWESGKEEPSIDELIFLAKLYKVSLDNLLNPKKSIESCYAKEDVHIGKDGIHVVDSDGSKVDISFKDGVHVSSNEYPNGKNKHEYNMNQKMFRRYHGLTMSIFTLVIIAAFLLLGFLIPNNQGWICGWTLFLLIPFIDSIFNVIKTGKPSHLFVLSIVIGIYCLLGLAGPKIWHPTWVMFFIVPIYHIVCGFFENKNN